MTGSDPPPDQHQDGTDAEAAPEPALGAALNAALTEDADAQPVGPVAAVLRMPSWVWKSVAIFWLGFLATIFGRFLFARLSSLLLLLLVSVFLSLAIEPGVNRLAARGWRRGRATMLILMGSLGVALLFVIVIGAQVGSQIADLLANSSQTVTKTVDGINDLLGTHIDASDVIDAIQDDDGPVQQFIQSQQNKVFDLSLTALGFLLQLFSVLLFTFYLVADGPRMRRSICSRMRPTRQEQVLHTWELAINKTGGYLYSRALLAGLSAVFHWILFQAIGLDAPIAMALWVGLISQFLPVVGTYIAGALPILLALIDSPFTAIAVLAFVALYQQIENYLFAPRITARTMELHPAIAFGAALGGAALLGGVGAILALPAAAMAQALISDWGSRHEV
ncbi:MAG TPA: AI-2E family transporter, partial [Ilumatobacteraceae bacterium]|nr:AI-2E family transporter [Ilumatobacteraceae bacterium]